MFFYYVKIYANFQQKLYNNMVSVSTKLQVIDNSGAIYARCIKILGFTRGIAGLGKKIIISIVRATPTKKIKEHEVRLALLVQTKIIFNRNVGVTLQFFVNYVIILDVRGNPIATRINCTLPQEFRTKRRLKFLLLGNNII